jgi:RNA polymerase sigma-70 factor, ECF subfamily
MIALPQNAPDTQDILCRHARQRIRRKARQLIGKAGLKPADREDLEQELALRLWRGLKDFDPSLGHSAAFVTTVLDRAANSILRLRNSIKRGSRHAHQVLLPPTIEEDDPDGGECSTEIGVSEVSHEATVDLVHDVAIVLSRLSPALRALAEDLKHRGITEIVASSGVARSTIYARIARLRAAFRSVN